LHHFFLSGRLRKGKDDDPAGATKIKSSHRQAPQRYKRRIGRLDEVEISVPACSIRVRRFGKLRRSEVDEPAGPTTVKSTHQQASEIKVGVSASSTKAKSTHWQASQSKYQHAGKPNKGKVNDQASLRKSKWRHRQKRPLQA